MDSIVYSFDSDEEINDNILDPDSLNPHDYELQKIINYFQDKRILKKKFNCTVCGKIMTLQKNKQYIERFCFRCRSKAPVHDIKVNLRNNSIFDEIKIPINVIYNLIFNCFIKNMSIQKAYINNSILVIK